MKSMYKKMLMMGCMVGLLTTGAVSNAEAASNPTISLLINGKGVQSDVTPIIKNQRMYVPIRVISEQTRAIVTYHADTQKIDIVQPTKTIQLKIGANQAMVAGQQVKLEEAPFIYKKRTFVPIRFVSQSLGYSVTWDQQAQVAKIASPIREKETSHRVVAGDSLWNLSLEYGISVDRLKSANFLASDQLLVGDDLTIPAMGDVQKAPSYTRNSYVVQSGDTLSAIAKHHQTTTELIELNNPALSSNLIVGQIIYLPEGATASQHSLEDLLFDKQLTSPTKRFPLSAKSYYEPVVNTYGDGRSWNPTTQESGRVHEGIDLMTDKGTPVYSVSNGTIERLGWNTYGGWRVNILDSNGKYNWYYAHLEAYSPSLTQGGYVKAGQLLGFVGDTGYGPVGTSGKFSPHLHFGMYYHQTDKATNPYYYLKYWEQQKVQSF